MGKGQKTARLVDKLMYRFFVMLLLILILLATCSGCAFMVAKETVKVIDIAL